MGCDNRLCAELGISPLVKIASVAVILIGLDYYTAYAVIRLGCGVLITLRLCLPI